MIDGLEALYRRAVAAARRKGTWTTMPGSMEVVRCIAGRQVEGEPSELLDRLERQAAESGRLVGRVEALENALRTERDARRRLGRR